MEKKIESELISIAHRILKLKGKSELHQLHIETQKLYETLSVLKFVEAIKEQKLPIDTQQVTDYFEANDISFDTAIQETEIPITEKIEEENIEISAKTLVNQPNFLIDATDKIIYIKELFANSTEDYNRVLNQILTFDNFTEVTDFIEQMVKPDYNNWVGKDQYAIHFMQAISQKFA